MGIRRQPGVYIEELSLAARTIADAPTSTTAFIGRTRRGPVDRPTRVASVAEFERIYGKPWAGAPLTAAIRHYFANGGREKSHTWVNGSCQSINCACSVQNSFGFSIEYW